MVHCFLSLKRLGFAMLMRKLLIHLLFVVDSDPLAMLLRFAHIEQCPMCTFCSIIMFINCVDHNLLNWLYVIDLSLANCTCDL